MLAIRRKRHPQFIPLLATASLFGAELHPPNKANGGLRLLASCLQSAANLLWLWSCSE